MKRKKIPYGTKLPVLLTPNELNLIRENTFCDPDLGKMGIVEGKNIKIMINLDDVEELQGHVAAEANHTKNNKLQKELDKIFTKLQVFLDTYDDQDEAWDW